jgi:hypothetical protein
LRILKGDEAIPQSETDIRSAACYVSFFWAKK